MAPLLRPLALAVALGLLGAVGVSAPVAMPDRVAPPPSVEYVALGDSYTAAPLVPPLELAGGCLRSGRNYPALVAAAVPGVRLDDRSCSNADTSHLTAAQDTGEVRVPPQLEALTAGTDLVTLSMGGNDFGLFAGMLGRCTALRDADPTGAPCRDAATRGGSNADLAVLPRIRARLVRAVREVRRRSPAADVLVVGYPQVVPAGAGCAALPFAAGDVAYARSVNRRLDETVEAAARRARATYVDVWAATAGHDICAAEPWVNGAQTDFERALAYHPFAEEQEAVARLVLEAW